ncbi:MAG: mycothiol synthase [Micrococcales bacterium]|nr:mycothiol synthase [Micrococcales bacterium]
MTLSPLAPEQVPQVRALLAAATAAEGVSALSEASLLGLTAPGARHALRYAADELVGYAQLWDDGAAELLVHPGHRRAGHGSALLAQLRTAGGEPSLWAHGNLPAAQAFCAAQGLASQRELYRMSRPLTDDDGADPVLPQGFSARAFRPGEDDEAWVATNAAAFAHHPEQGRLTLADLHERMAQPWFDAAGLIVVEDDGRPADAPPMAAFHWTKVDPDQPSSLDPARAAGEVYVVGVHPAYQGRGLAAPLTGLGLAHLARSGAPEVFLYVDGDNVPARRTYARAGFTDASVDVVWGGASAPESA